MEELLHQGYCFLLSMGCGAFLTLCYGLLRGLQRLCGIREKPGRRLPGRQEAVVAAGDILFWIVAAVFCFVIIFRENAGEARGYMLAGALLGMFFLLFIRKGLKNFLRRVTIRQQ